MSKRELKLIKGNGHKRIHRQRNRPSVSLKLLESEEAGQSGESMAARTAGQVRLYRIVAEPANVGEISPAA